MIAFTIHAYSTDSTEGVLLTEDETMTEAEAAGYWWNKNKDIGSNPINTWANIENICAIKRDTTQV
jgi:hypothetical protein